MLPNGVRVREDVFQGGEARPHDARTPHGVRIAHWSRLVHHRVQAKRRNQGDLLTSTLQPELQDAVRPVSEQFDGYSRQPATQQMDHLAGPHAEGFVADPESRADLWGGGQHTQKGQRPPVPGPGHTHHHCQHDPARSSTIQRKPGLLTDR